MFSEAGAPSPANWYSLMANCHCCCPSRLCACRLWMVDCWVRPTRQSASSSRMDRPALTNWKTRLGLAFADRKSTRLNSSHQIISYAVFCLKRKPQTRVVIGDEFNVFTNEALQHLCNVAADVVQTQDGWF